MLVLPTILKWIVAWDDFFLIQSYPWKRNLCFIPLIDLNNQKKPTIGKMHQVEWAAAQHLFSPFSSPFFWVKWVFDFGFRFTQRWLPYSPSLSYGFFLLYSRYSCAVGHGRIQNHQRMFLCIQILFNRSACMWKFCEELLCKLCWPIFSSLWRASFLIFKVYSVYTSYT